MTTIFAKKLVGKSSSFHGATPLVKYCPKDITFQNIFLPFFSAVDLWKLWEGRIIASSFIVTVERNFRFQFCHPKYQHRIHLNSCKYTLIDARATVYIPMILCKLDDSFSLKFDRQVAPITFCKPIFHSAVSLQPFFQLIIFRAR